jgi:AraC family transcriptional regulator
MTPKIDYLTEKKLIGTHLRMSLVDNKTSELWQWFMPRRKEIQNKVNTDFISLQVYDNPLYFNAFNPKTRFEKWALLEVSNVENVPDGMEVFTLVGGQYAVFNYKGNAQGAPAFFNYIFTVWLPNSAFILDNRPHFEVLGEKYKNDSDDSEEEVWIPIKSKY